MSAGADPYCKGCSNDYRVTKEHIDRILSSPMFQPDSGICVPDEVYEERLKLCNACPRLMGGETCSLCGCFVRVRAKFQDQSCPAPEGSGWQRYSGG